MTGSLPTPLQPTTRALLRDGATLAAGICLIVGTVSLVLGWRGVAATSEVYEQVTLILSGVLPGVVLIGSGLALTAIQVNRAAEARVAVAYAGLAAEVASLRRELGAHPSAGGTDTELPPPA